MEFKNKKSNIEYKKGFTLVEIIVAIGIFVTAVTISLGAVVGLYSANNKSQSLASVINNLSYSIENMTRTIRFGDNYHCGSPTGPTTCPNGDAFLSVTFNSQTIKYQFQGGKLQTATDSGPFTNITSSDVTIEHGRFRVFDQGPNSQPYVLMVIKGYAGKKPSEQSRFDIETVVSQRILDL
jgi:prepilin-type N-terminal cleavage/methylation domain-containing protein